MSLLTELENEIITPTIDITPRWGWNSPYALSAKAKEGGETTQASLPSFIWLNNSADDLRLERWHGYLVVPQQLQHVQIVPAIEDRAARMRIAQYWTA
jgi:hypothetical protein